MKTVWPVGCSLWLVAALCHGADIGVVTVLDGGARLLRGATWYKLVEGARVLEGDVIEAAGRAQVQLELSSADTLNTVGPASLYVAGAASREGKQPAVVELYMPQGWIKLATKPPAAPLRLRTPLGSVEGSNAVAVVHVAANAFEVFIESGGARLTEAGRSGTDSAPRDARGGDFVSRAADRPFTVASGAPQAFVIALPRHFMDTLPARAEKFRTARVELAVDHPITFAEAEPWLAGPYRRTFIKRLQSRLSDAAFRSAVMADIQAYPEWSSLLVPQPVAKTEPPAKAPEKQQSSWPWPFGGSRK